LLFFAIFGFFPKLFKKWGKKLGSNKPFFKKIMAVF